MVAIRPYIIGSALTLIVGTFIYIVWLYKGNQTLREKNEDLKSENDYQKIKDQNHQLTDSELSAKLHDALKPPGDGSGSGPGSN